MSNLDRNKQIIQHFVQIVWRDRNLATLQDFWTADCINHAMSEPNNRGLDVLRDYHEAFMTDLSG